jgi:CheY-like chemotaxis protein
MVERGEPPDAILMDYEMPVMNGPSATARLRELGCACLIVGVTGNVLPQDVAYFIAQGAEAVLPKPVVLEDFEHIMLSRLGLGTTLPSGAAIESSECPGAIISDKGKRAVGRANSSRIYVDESASADTAPG